MPSNLCPHCGARAVKLFRQINGNGANVIIAKCTTCDRVPDKKRPFISKAEVPDWQTLPLYTDFTENSRKCEYRGCDRKDTELHHFAPIALFGYEVVSISS